MRFLVIHGPNLNLLGQRNREIYGVKTLEEINQYIQNYADENNLHIDIFQSNCEGEIIDLLHNSQKEYQGVVLNPAAYTHYSYAIADAVEAITTPVVEVHLSNIHGREEFRRKSVIAPYAQGQIAGFGHFGYILGINALMKLKKEG